MALDRLTDDMNFVANLGDDPKRDDGLSTPQFKSYFDKSGLLIQNFINNKLIPQIENAINEGSLLQQISEALGKKLDKSGGVMTGNIGMNENRITGLPKPISDSDAVPRSYVDEVSRDLEKKALRFTNITAPASAFIADGTYEDYPFRAAVALKDVTAKMIPQVCFGLKEATSGAFAPVCETYNGGIYIYSLEKPESDVVILSALCFKEA